MAAHALELRNVIKRLGGKKVLNALSLTLDRGSLLVVLGPSGSGKSVLLKHCIGLMAPDEGEVWVDGVNVWKASPSQRNRLRQTFGLAFQEGALFDSLNVFENVAFPLRRHSGKSEREISERVNQCLGWVRLTEAASKMPSELSTGMRRRVGFARAVALAPTKLLFDEPTAGLDNVMVTVLAGLIRQLTQELQAATVVVTHDLQLARRVADRVTLLWKGQLVAEDATEAFFASTHPAVRQLLDGLTEGPLTAANQTERA